MRLTRLWHLLLIGIGIGFCLSVASAQSHVLSLDGNGDYVEVANNEGLNAIDSQVTVEA